MTKSELNIEIYRDVEPMTHLRTCHHSYYYYFPSILNGYFWNCCLMVRTGKLHSFLTNALTIHIWQASLRTVANTQIHTPYEEQILNLREYIILYVDTPLLKTLYVQGNSRLLHSLQQVRNYSLDPQGLDPPEKKVPRYEVQFHFAFNELK